MGSHTGGSSSWGAQYFGPASSGTGIECVNCFLLVVIYRAVLDFDCHCAKLSSPSTAGYLGPINNARDTDIGDVVTAY